MVRVKRLQGSCSAGRGQELSGPLRFPLNCGSLYSDCSKIFLVTEVYGGHLLHIVYTIYVNMLFIQLHPCHNLLLYNQGGLGKSFNTCLMMVDALARETRLQWWIYGQHHHTNTAGPGQGVVLKVCSTSLEIRTPWTAQHPSSGAEAQLSGFSHNPDVSAARNSCDRV